MGDLLADPATIMPNIFGQPHLDTAFTNLWTLFLSTPRFLAAESTFKRSLPFFFTGGLGMLIATVGLAGSIIGIILVLLLQVTARIFTLPATIILLNNCSPHPSVLGTIHGLGQSVSAGFRTVGPVVAGSWYGSGLNVGLVGVAWWGILIMSVACCETALGMHAGSGHEVFREGEGHVLEAEALLNEKAVIQAPERSASRAGTSRGSRDLQA